jgi:hypothetical protein
MTCQSGLLAAFSMTISPAVSAKIILFAQCLKSQIVVSLVVVQEYSCVLSMYAPKTLLSLLGYMIINTTQPYSKTMHNPSFVAGSVSQISLFKTRLQGIMVQ